MFTLHPTPGPVYRKSYTLHPTSWHINPAPYALNHKASPTGGDGKLWVQWQHHKLRDPVRLKGLESGVNELWFRVYGLWFMVYGLWFMVYG